MTDDNDDAYDRALADFTAIAEGEDEAGFIELVPARYDIARDVQRRLTILANEIAQTTPGMRHVEGLIAVGNLFLAFADNLLEGCDDLELFEANRAQVEMVLRIMQGHVGSTKPISEQLAEFKAVGMVN